MNGASGPAPSLWHDPSRQLHQFARPRFQSYSLALTLVESPTRGDGPTYLAPIQTPVNPQLLLLALFQGLFLSNNVTFVAINGLVGLSLAPLPWMATLPIAGYVAGGAVLAVAGIVLGVWGALKWQMRGL
jgi:hypothetical protein